MKAVYGADWLGCPSCPAVRSAEDYSTTEAVRPHNRARVGICEADTQKAGRRVYGLTHPRCTAISRAKKNICENDKTEGRVMSQHFKDAVKAKDTYSFVYEPDRKIDWTLS